MTLEETSTDENRTSAAQSDAPDAEDIEVDPEESISDERCTELRQRRIDDELYMEISTDYTLNPWDVVAHIRGTCDCEADADAIEDDKPWTEKELVEELFIEQNYHFTEIAELFDCHHETVKNWARDQHQITIVDDSIRTSSKTVRQLQRIGIQNEDDIDLPPEARDSPFNSDE